ncbi:hypothetical protein NQ318_001877 [Aromia moschata]|uniref:RING-type domain-containing protein n=1 Tax=Aromia moschata TaxID=1265417 RepID=A0AAV8Z144_9CUCU|nr:hypothetical protein NQ318_001877 [Aromia moschata]
MVSIMVVVFWAMLSRQRTCDLCHGYLSVPPISTHEDKVSCGRCNPGWPRNHVYERLAQFVLFPCTYCGDKLSWNDVPKHEQKCRRNVILCPAGYARDYNLSKMPSSNPGEYHPECQARTISCPFDYCDVRYEIRDVSPHFQKFHQDYVFSSNHVTARKNMKEEKVWNFNSDNQVCLVVFKQMPFLLYIHSDCNYDENTGDIVSYDYYFGVFFLLQEPIRLEIHRFGDLGFGRGRHVVHNEEPRGLIKHSSFDFMTTRFQDLTKLPDMKLTYTVKLLDGFEASEQDTKPKPNLKVDNIGKNSECPICKEYMHPPVYNCDLGHSVCKNCKSKMTICPFCKAFIGNSRNFVIRGHPGDVADIVPERDKGLHLRGQGGGVEVARTDVSL